LLGERVQTHSRAFSGDEAMPVSARRYGTSEEKTVLHSPLPIGHRGESIVEAKFSPRGNIVSVLVKQPGPRGTTAWEWPDRVVLGNWAKEQIYIRAGKEMPGAKKKGTAVTTANI
jgi:hypothetical protein